MKKILFSQMQIYEFIKKHEPFNLMSDKCLLKIASVLEVNSHPGDSLLIKKGENFNDLYILIKGRLYYQVTDAEDRVTYQGEFYEGDIIGEMALISDLPRSADVYTLRDSIILKLTKKNFLELSQIYPELLNKITQFTIKRLTNSLQGINKEHSHNKSIALIPIHRIPDSAHQLNQMVSKFPYGEKILLLTNECMSECEGLLDEEGNLSHEGILWIDQKENEYSFIFYLADDTLSNWTKFCIRQADSIALIALADNKEYKLSTVEHYINDMKHHFLKRTILMLLHKTADRPQNTQYWLQHRKVTNHYHVRIDTDKGMSRMMRIFTDNTVSLVLSGGGARGLAHIGFYKLLEERNIPVDYIAGTSMGAMIAAFFACGYTSTEVLEIVNEVLIKSSKIDFTFPYIAISSGKRASAGLINVFGQKGLIEDLWLNYFCVSTDLVSQNLFVHDKGLLWESVRSSLSLPFIYPPVSIGDKLLLDGGILNNIPIDVMRQYSRSNKIIASNITGHNSFKLSPLPSALSGWKLLYNKLRGNESILPLNLGELVLRLLTISSHQNTEKMIAMADECISLRIEKYGMLDFKHHKQIAELGYIQAKEQFTAKNLEELLNHNPQTEEQLKFATG
ncbi:MAG: cyclic nucleotide-binding and patatin-like phospholipase domain-containing protein [Legionella sp.]|nr:cyclic nucleotide-binding and patatin-like phospholipase domain-containing protein [Legionella sp.]